VLLTTLLWAIAWVIAEAIPVFNNLLGVVVSRTREAVDKTNKANGFV
jgi:hypothetical protein